ncbi:MAG: purple acid phosphatase family protein [Planctomycetota bacterium JB042]
MTDWYRGAASRVALLSLLIVAACSDPPPGSPPPWSVPEVGAEVAAERFIVLGDMGTGLPGQHEVARHMAERAAEHGVAFLLTVGDNFYPDGVTSVDDPQWRTKLEEVYDAPSLRVPVFATLGNHDHRGSVDAQVASGALDGRWRMPARWYAFERRLDDGTTVGFFALDTESLRRGGDDERREQLEWLDRELARSAARWKVTFGHHPPFTHGHHDGSGTMRRTVVPLLEEHDVDLHLAGHNHHLELLEPKNGVAYVVSGAAGGTEKAYEVEWGDDTVYASTGGGFVVGTITRERLALEFVEADGATGFAWEIGKE